MIIKDIKINQYRKFNDVTIILGKFVTCLAGHNAVGKSTILGLLGHCAELKKADGSTLFDQAFRAHLNDIIKFSSKFDQHGSNLYTITFDDLPRNSDVNSHPYDVSFRAYWTSDPRYRLIPMKTEKRNTEKKVVWPTFYLGLSRLYPVGEANRINTTKNSKKFSENDIKYIYDNYEKILSKNEKITKITSISIDEVSKKKSLGFSTETYDYLSNSAGQDNLGQIITAVLSFKKLKESKTTNWCGGLLLIDELDATLHPSAQNNLFDFLFKEAKTLGIQVVFTTHSLSLLEHISYKTTHNTDDNNNNIELCYLTTANKKLEIFRNISMSGIYYDLTCTYQGATPPKQILLYSEDYEARWFFKHMLKYAKNKIDGFPSDILSSIKLLDIKLGFEQLLTLLGQDFDYFKRCIFLLDGDVTDDNIKKYNNKLPININEKNPDNKIILRLPGNYSPEQILYNYIEQLDAESGFFTCERFVQGITHSNLMGKGPFSEQYNEYTKDREKYKNWFKDNESILNDLIYYWMCDNHNVVCDFLIMLESVYNFAAKLNNMQTITFKQHVVDSCVENNYSSQIPSFS